MSHWRLTKRDRRAIEDFLRSMKDDERFVTLSHKRWNPYPQNIKNMMVDLLKEIDRRGKIIERVGKCHEDIFYTNDTNAKNVIQSVRLSALHDLKGRWA